MNFKNDFKNKAFKKGTYSVGMIFAVLAIVVLLNMLVRELPATITKFDFSKFKLYTLTDTTIDFLKSLDKEVNIYLIAAQGSEDENLYEMLEKYDAMSGYVNFEQVDPTLYPNFVAEYTTEVIETNSIIVDGGERSRVIDYSNMATTVLNYNTFTYDSAFDGEGLVTSAINYVVTDNLPKMYLTAGHNEQEMNETFIGMVGKASVQVETVNILENKGIPEDCEVLFTYTPTEDFTSAEADIIIEYLENGGSYILVTQDMNVDLVNLGKVLEYYGVEFTGGFAIENNSKYYLTYTADIKPIRNTHPIMNSLIAKGTSVFAPRSQGIVIRDDARSSLEITELLTTSEDSFVRTTDSDAVSIQDGDIPGPIAVAVAIEESYNGADTHLAVFGSSYLINDSVDQTVGGGNYDMLLNTIAWMSEIEANIAIEAKTTTISLLSLAQSDIYRWMIILVVVIPVAVIGTGFAVWFMRRRK